MFSSVTRDEVKRLLESNNDILLDQIVEIINASLICKDGGRVVRKDPNEEKKIQELELAKRRYRESDKACQL